MKKPYHRKFRTHRKPKALPPKMKPGMDPLLEKAFAAIGVPPKKEFQADVFQLEALAAIEKGDCLVSAPTGSGKTWIAETLIQKILTQKGKAWYATPLKALTNSIYAHFAKRVGRENVGILTGDRKENPDAPLIIGTTEILRNHLYDAMHLGVDLATDFVVLDEAHFLGDRDRGVVWEEIMIYLPVRIPLLLLSATIGNADQIAAWLMAIRGRTCFVIAENKRPVPLYPLYLHPAGTLLPFWGKPKANGHQRLYKKVLKLIGGKRPSLSSRRKLPPFADIIRILRTFNLLPAIFFMKSRSDCDTAIELCNGESLAENPARKEQLEHRIKMLTNDQPHIANHRHEFHLTHLAVGSHHGGQLPAWKIVVETLMAEGLLDAVFATSTVAAGVNFPARTVVLLDSDRFNGTEFMPLTATEFHQMTGRAGRRGKDKIGFALMLPGRFMEVPWIAKLINAPPGNVDSQIKINFSMVLNLLLSHSPAEIKKLLEKSFATFQLSTANKKKASRIFNGDVHFLWRDFKRHLKFLHEKGFVTATDQLTDDGKWTSKLRIDQPLLVAEGVRLKLFPDEDPVLMAAVMASFVYDRETEREEIDKGAAPKKLLTVFLAMKRGLRPFIRCLNERGFESTPLYFKPAQTVYAWAAGKDWETVIQTAGLAEGDLARLILRTADNLRHMKSVGAYFPKLAMTAAASVDLLLREPIV